MPTRGARRRTALNQFSETLWWILPGRSFQRPSITFCWNGDKAYTTAFILTGCFPIVFLIERDDGILLGLLPLGVIRSGEIGGLLSAEYDINQSDAVWPSHPTTHTEISFRMCQLVQTHVLFLSFSFLFEQVRASSWITPFK